MYVQRGQGGNTLGTAGVMGSGETTNMAKTSTANTGPSNFTNIQDFLSANKGTPKVQGMVEGKAKNEVTQGQNALQSAKSSLSALPTATEYSQDVLNQNLDQNNYDQIYNLANQTYTPETTNALTTDINPSSGFQGMKQGDFGSIMDFFGSAQPTSSTYNPAMQRQDELLLRGSKDFNKDFVPNAQNAYKTGVTDPLNQARTERADQVAQVPGQMQKANESWKGGIGSWLSGQSQQVNDILAKQQAEEAARANIGKKFQTINNPYTPAGAQYHDAGQVQVPVNNQDGTGYFDIYGYNAGTPSQATAEQAYMTQNPSGYEDYNALANKFGSTLGSPYAPMVGGATYTPGEWAKLYSENLRGEQYTPGGG